MGFLFLREDAFFYLSLGVPIYALTNRIRGYQNEVRLRGLREKRGFVGIAFP